MKPDRSNYEIWLIDWLDGILDKDQEEQLLLFLNENPDLKEEVDSLSDSHLSPSTDLNARINIRKKTPSDLPYSQIEYLSVAYLEKDLSADQLVELSENTGENPENRILFESIQKIRLEPQAYFYKNKKALKKLTIGEKVIRFSVMGLSAAATIAILILSYIFIPDQLSERKNPDLQSMNSDTGKIMPFVVRTKTYRVIPEKPEFIYANNISSPADFQINLSVDKTEQQLTMAISDSPVQKTDYAGIEIPVYSVFLKPAVNIDPLPGILIASNNDFTVQLPDDERNKLSKFIARTFREKLLNEKNSGDDPVKAYEIAEAGVEGLNKLLGWDMALVATNNEAGDLKSVYFSSRILKFNSPVKKDDAAQ